MPFKFLAADRRDQDQNDQRRPVKSEAAGAVIMFKIAEEPPATEDEELDDEEQR